MTNNKSISDFKFQIVRFFLVALLLLGIIRGSKVHAADFKADYQVQYDLTDFKETLAAKVRFNIKITNLKTEVYVNKFAIGFPKTFTIANLQSSDDRGQIEPKITSDEFNTKVEMEFSNPNIGRDSVNNFYLNFDQSNLFQLNGKVWEVVLPVIENRQDGNYQIVVILPEKGDRKISIAKPKPSSIVENKIIWDNPTEKTIYAVFGDYQVYKTELVYHLKNYEVIPVVTEVTFPPDTLYQKTFIDSVNPPPTTSYQDNDGNLFGKYLLKPLETKTITYKGFVEVFPSARSEIKPIINQQIEIQKNFLLTSQKYWKIDKLDKIVNLTSPRDIYDFTVKNLKYNYQKVIANNIRLGANQVLINPDQAVCLEFTDLFVGISREKGIMAREVEGFGFSFDPKLQPLSLVSDVLHAWPEYYDENLRLWIPLDPTWENTSGIDYFTSFDMNHIVFAIHGKKSDYPLPAGMYKIDDSKDISIKATVEEPVEKKSVSLKNLKIIPKIFENRSYQGEFTIKNDSNVYLLDVPIHINSDNLKIDNAKTSILSLAPYEIKQINFKYQSQPQKSKGKFSVDVFGQKLIEESIVVIPSIFLIILSTTGSLIILLVLISTVKYIKSRR
jgi:hypothetical protein